jgi:peptidoglycan hydrolase-like protein with peptidoglycan-binding domain
MKRTLFVLGVSAMLAMPVLATGQMSPGASGTGSGPGAGGSGPGAQMQQHERRGQGQMDMQQADVRQVQERLKEAGFNPGPVDGQLGPQTREALKEYQKAHGLAQTGQLDEPTRDLLMAQSPQDAPSRMQSPGGAPGSQRQDTRPGETMPGGRSPGESGTGSSVPGGSSSSR